MNKQLKQAGFGVVEVILILAVLGLVGFVGWRLYDQNKSKTTNTTTTQQESAIEKAEDLDQTVDTLNNQNIDEDLDTSEIDSTLE
jgi:predicted negative regulator of RcsB-dependent stress response